MDLTVGAHSGAGRFTLERNFAGRPIWFQE